MRFNVGLLVRQFICSSIHPSIHPLEARSFQMRPRISVRGFVRPSVCRSVRPSIHRSVTPVQKPRFSAVFGHDEILHWIYCETNMIWEPPLLLLSFHLSVCPSVNPYVSHDQYTQRHSLDASLPVRACWHIPEKHGFHFRIGKFQISIEQVGPQ